MAQRTQSQPEHPLAEVEARLAEPEQLIAEAERDGAGALNLSGREFDAKAFSRHIPRLASLPKLTTLDLGGNNIDESGARAIAEQLTKLTTLDLWGNNIGDAGARAIAEKLTNLTTLDLGYNNIGEAGARVIAKKLTDLTTLNLSSNHIGEAGARAIADKLTNLTTLDLGYNNIGEAGARAIAEAVRARRLRKLEWLSLDGNNLGIPGAALESRDPQYLAREILALGRRREARVVVAGEPGVGKSWLCNVLFRDVENEPGAREETHHFERIDWDLERTGKPNVDLRIWDFGGQHVLHATHELFFEPRTLYLAVLDVTKLPGDNAIDYWLKMIRHFAGDAVPVIVVVTKCDLGHPDRLGKLSRRSLKALHPGVRPVITGVWSSGARRTAREKGLAVLRAAIAKGVGAIGALEQRESEQYAGVREAVRDRDPRRPLLCLRDYRRMCADAGETNERYQEYDLRRLHEWGDVFYFGVFAWEREEAHERRGALPPGQWRRLTHERDSALTNWLIDPDWIARPIYEIARASEASNCQGKLTLGEMKEIVRKAEAVLSKAGLLTIDGGLDERVAVVLALLKHIEMCFALGDAMGTYIFPRGLSDKPQGRLPDWHETAAPITLRWGNFIPETVFHRFMVRFKSRELIEPGEAAYRPPVADRVWRRGAVVTVNDVPVAVTIQQDVGRIEIRLPPGTTEDKRKGVLDIVIHHLEQLAGRRAHEQTGAVLETKSIPAALVGAGPAADTRGGDGSAGPSWSTINRAIQEHPYIKDSVYAYIWGANSLDGFDKLMGWERKLAAVRKAEPDGDWKDFFDPSGLPGPKRKGGETSEDALKRAGDTFRKHCAAAGIKSRTPVPTLGTGSLSVHRGSKHDLDPKRDGR